MTGVVLYGIHAGLWYFRLITFGIGKVWVAV